MSKLFLRVAKDRLYQHVARQIQDLIISGELRPGDRLPSEAELCEQFDVSRTVIREATRCLVDRGLLSAEPGRGTFITAMSHQDLSDSIDLFVKSSEISDRNLIEVRELLEVKIAELAAARAQPEHLLKMEQALERLGRNHSSIEEIIRADLDFHMALAEATQNEIFLAFIGSLVPGLQDIRRMTTDVSTGLGRFQTLHKTIYDCVQEGDKEGAAEAMRQHLRETARRIQLARSKAEADKTA